MNVVDELDRLVELRERGHLSCAEYDEVKQHLLQTSRRAVAAPDGGAPAPDGAYLLYRLIASWLRRASATMAVVALLFALVAGWAGLHYRAVSAQTGAIKDVTIAHGFGLRILDPLPTIERTTLEAKATVYGGVTAVTGAIALSTLVAALLLRPPSPRPER
ncbi:MAG TPA: SHOCT domain-containing protein [Pseudonocardiaceae bacterium]|jgi:hypothetical protein|nr:SHOCT domain-containing protein [Pseudonocardiaceae bacterium]